MNRMSLDRTTYHAPAPKPARIVHIGLGAFHRAHQAWYTHRTDNDGSWGIAAFTGRRPDAAAALAAQDGLYVLIERAEHGDSFEVVTSIVEAHDGANIASLSQLLAAHATALITLTITEAAYNLAPDGKLDAQKGVVLEDIVRISKILAAGDSSAADELPETPAGRLVLALDARRRSGGGGIAVVSCDNLTNNATAAREAIQGLAAAVDETLADWIGQNVSFVGTSVDRITPRTTEADLSAVAEACGYLDNSPVVAEPFRNWVLSGDFPGGRPRWEAAGAVFVDDIEPYENRKLWLLNGAHSLLAYSGLLRGHTTVAEALQDETCLNTVEQFWDEAANHLNDPGLGIPQYRQELMQRFSNSRISHQLAQIATDGTNKLRMRVLPVLAAERAQGRDGRAAALVLAAWVDYVAAVFLVQDALADDLALANSLTGSLRTQALLRLVDPALADDEATVNLVHSLTGAFERSPLSASALHRSAHHGLNG